MSLIAGGIGKCIALPSCPSCSETQDSMLSFHIPAAGIRLTHHCMLHTWTYMEGTADVERGAQDNDLFWAATPSCC